jgi:endo-1,4-beta-xylanase
MFKSIFTISILVASLAGAQTRSIPEWKWNNPPNLLHDTIHSKLVGEEVGYMIALPDDYYNSTNHYPVIYFLHGASGNENAYWDKTIPKINEAKPALEPFILVFVNGGRYTFYADSPDGSLPVESIIVKELIPHIDQTYRTKAERKSRAIEGSSMGGFGALSLGMRHPDLFATVVAYAPALINVREEGGVLTLGSTDTNQPLDRRLQMFKKSFGGDADYFESYSPFSIAEKQSNELRDKLPIRIVVGSNDSLLDDCESFHALMNKLRYDHEFVIVPEAGHSFRQTSANGLYVDGLRFHQRSRQ